MGNKRKLLKLRREERGGKEGEVKKIFIFKGKYMEHHKEIETRQRM